MNLEGIVSNAKSAIEAVTDLAALDEIRVQYLGKKGELPLQMRELGKLPPEEKPKAGQLINQAKQVFTGAL